MVSTFLTLIGSSFLFYTVRWLQCHELNGIIKFTRGQHHLDEACSVFPALNRRQAKKRRRHSSRRRSHWNSSVFGGSQSSRTTRTKPPVLPPMSTPVSSDLFRRPWPESRVALLACSSSSPLQYAYKTCSCSGLSDLLVSDSLWCTRSNIAPRRYRARAFWASMVFFFFRCLLAWHAKWLLFSPFKDGLFQVFGVEATREAEKRPHLCSAP